MKEKIIMSKRQKKEVRTYLTPVCAVECQNSRGFEFIPDMCVERVEEGTTNVSPGVVVVLEAFVRRGDGEDLIASVWNFGSISAIVVQDEASRELGDLRS